jgi:acetyl esterase/lipase
MRAALLVFAPIFALAASACSGSSPAAPPQPTTQQSNPVTQARLMTWDDLLGRPRPTPTQTVQWGAGATDVADLWLPERAGLHPVVVMVHGGCWQKEVADRTIMDWAAEDLRARGIAVWNIEYRGVDEAGGGYPGTFLNVAHAADALRDQAAANNLDLSRVAAFGHSAGGHLAMWLAARTRLPASSPLRMDAPLKLVGVVNSGGLADLAESKDVTARSCLADIYDKLVGPISSSRARVLSDTSPAEMLPLGVHQISVNGHRDIIAPPVLGESIARKATAAGDRAEAKVVLGAGHAELIAPGTQAWDVEVAALKVLLGVK